MKKQRRIYYKKIFYQRKIIIEKCKELEEENNHLKVENKKRVIVNQKYDNLVSSNQVKISSVKNIR